MGVRAWLKLARHLFVKPKDGCLSTKDVTIKKEEEVNNPMRTNKTEDKILMQKNNILQRLVEALDKINDDKDRTIKFLSERVETL